MRIHSLVTGAHLIGRTAAEAMQYSKRCIMWEPVEGICMYIYIQRFVCDIF